MKSKDVERLLNEATGFTEAKTVPTGSMEERLAIIDQKKNSLKAGYDRTSDDSYITRGGYRDALWVVSRIEEGVKEGKPVSKNLDQALLHSESDWSDRAVASLVSGHIEPLIKDLEKTGYRFEESLSKEQERGRGKDDV